MAGKEGKTTGREGRQPAIDHLLVQAFLVGATWEAAAVYAKVSESTVRRRMASSQFKAKLREARSALVTRTVDRLGTLALKAAATLGELLESNHEGIRLAAARSLLETSFAVREATELEARIAALEFGQSEPEGMRLIG